MVLDSFQFPHVEIKKRDFCRSVWKLETSSDVLSSVSLTAHIHNTGQVITIHLRGGHSNQHTCTCTELRRNCSKLTNCFPQGGGSFVVGVNCSSGLQAFPSSPVTLWIDKVCINLSISPTPSIPNLAGVTGRGEISAVCGASVAQTDGQAHVQDECGDKDCETVCRQNPAVSRMYPEHNHLPRHLQ